MFWVVLDAFEDTVAGFLVLDLISRAAGLELAPEAVSEGQALSAAGLAVLAWGFLCFGDASVQNGVDFSAKISFGFKGLLCNFPDFVFDQVTSGINL